MNNAFKQIKIGKCNILLSIGKFTRKRKYQIGITLQIEKTLADRKYNRAKLFTKPTLINSYCLKVSLLILQIYCKFNYNALQTPESMKMC